jgi:hypothetical protein
MGQMEGLWYKKEQQNKDIKQDLLRGGKFLRVDSEGRCATCYHYIAFRTAEEISIDELLHLGLCKRRLEVGVKGILDVLFAEVSIVGGSHDWAAVGLGC